MAEGSYIHLSQLVEGVITSEGPLHFRNGCLIVPITYFDADNKPVRVEERDVTEEVARAVSYFIEEAR